MPGAVPPSCPQSARPADAGSLRLMVSTIPCRGAAAPIVGGVKMDKALPSGTYRCRVIGRRTRRLGDGVAIELEFEVAIGPRAGSRVSGRFRHVRLVQRARLLREHQVVEVDVVLRRGRAGRAYSSVIGFREAGETVPITIAWGGTLADPVAAATYEPVDVCTMREYDEWDACQGLMPEDCDGVPPVPVLSPSVLWELDHAIDESSKPHAETPPVRSQPPEDNTIYLGHTARFAASHCWSVQVVSDGPVAQVRPIRCDDMFGRFCRADSGLDLDRPTDLSAYEFTTDLASHCRAHAGRLDGYGGMVWSRRLTVAFGLGPDPRERIDSCRWFVRGLLRLGVPAMQVLCFSDGHRCLEVMFPSGILGSVPRTNYPSTAGHVCQLLVDRATRSLEWDALTSPQRREREDSSWHRWISPAVYGTGALLQAPNTRCEPGRTFKVRLTVGDLLGMPLAEIATFAKIPRPFEPPPWQASPYELLSEIWWYAAAVADSRSPLLLQHVHGEKWIYTDTLEFMQFGASPATCGKRLFRAAANLLDFGCPRPLLSALLLPPAFANGLAPDEIDRRLEAAIRYVQRQREVSTERRVLADDESPFGQPEKGANSR
jgi:hypothetical protein